MKKILFIPLIAFMVGCNPPATKPIEKYKNKGIVVLDTPRPIYNHSIVELRVKDENSVFFIYLTPFDCKDLKEGDTIK
jgi:hypothetical protein